MSPRGLAQAAAPPLLGCAAWLLLFASYGFRGWNLQEDGYLLALAARVLRGEALYLDFEYIRPPLPVLIQAALLGGLPGYGVAASRGYFALQGALTLVLGYLLLARVDPSRWVRITFGTLATVFAFTGGFPPMPWHTVDGVTFSLLATWALLAAIDRRRPGLAAAAGAAAAAAALSKQGFVVVLLAGALALLAPAGRRLARSPFGGVTWYLCGVAIPSGAMLAYLLWHRAVGAAIASVIVHPREITREVSVLQFSTWDLVVGMHLPHWESALGGVMLLGLVALPISRVARLGLVLAGVAWLAWLLLGGQLLHRAFVVEVFCTASWLGGFLLLVRPGPGQRSATAEGGSTRVMVLLGLATLYAATWSYVPRISGAQGLSLALPASLLGLLGLAGERSPAADRRAGCLASLAVLLVMASLAALTQLSAPGTRGPDIVGFRTPRLAGIATHRTRVEGIDGVVALIDRETRVDDPIFVFMNFPALYFLANRPNPTRIDWFIPIELAMSEVRRAVADLAARPPRLVILNTPDPRPMLDSPRLRPVFGHILEHYEEAHAIGEFLVLRPRTGAGAPGPRS